MTDGAPIRHGTPQWYAARREGIGASEVAALLNAHDYLTEQDLFVAKLAGRDVRPNLAMVMGTYLEPYLLELYRARATDLSCAAVVQHMQHDHEAPHLFATPDAVYGRDDASSWHGVLETKVTWAEPFKSCPLAWQVQTEAQMAVTGLAAARVAVLHLVPGLTPDDAFQVFDVPRHDGVIARMRERVEEWWAAHIEARVPPPPSIPGAPIPLRVWEALHPRDSGATVELPAEAVAIDERLREIGGLLKALDVERDGLRARLAECIGDATYGCLPDGGRWKWGYEERREHTVRASAGRQMRRVGREKRR